MSDQTKKKMVKRGKSNPGDRHQTSTPYGKMPFARATAIRRKAYSGLMYPGAIEMMSEKAHDLEIDRKH